MAQPGVLPGLASVLSGVEGGFSVLSSDCHTRVFPVVYICGTLSPVGHAISFLQIVQNFRQIIIGRVLGIVYYRTPRPKCKILPGGQALHDPVGILPEVL